MINPAASRSIILQAAAAVLLSLAPPLRAAEPMPAPRILVSGQGSVSVAPDMALLSLSVTREAATAREALDASSAAMESVIEAMKAEGIEARDLKTSDFSIQPRYLQPPPDQTGRREPARIVGYTVRNSLSVRVRDLSTLGAILDKSVTLGVNQGGNVTFTNSDPSKVLEKARVMAVKQALAKAQTLAAAAGVKAGKILEISEQSHNPRPQPMGRMELAAAVPADRVPVESGENTYRVTVSLRVAIEQ